MSAAQTGGRPSSDILERLIGETAEPDQVTKAARSFAERSLGPLRAALAEAAGQALAIELDAIEVCRMRQPTADAAPFDALCVASAVDAPDALVIRIDATAIAIFVDALFGAEADAPLKVIDRELSGVELEVAGLVAHKLAGVLNGSGQRALQFRFPLPAMLAGDAVARMALRDGPAVRIAFGVARGADTGRVEAVLPQRLLVKPRDGGATDPAGAATNEWSARFSEQVMRSTVRLEATMPVGKMSLGAIAALRSGQVIELAEAAQAQAKLSARNKTLFICEFGRLGQNYTVRIKKPVECERGCRQ